MNHAPAPTDAPPGLPARAPRALGLLLRLDRQLQRVEVALCAASLLLMIGLAFAQVLLRSFRTETLQPVAWFDNIARHLVIWVGMLGASLATAEGRHISIEVLPKLLGPRGRRRNELLVSAASLTVVGVLFVLSMIYMLRVQVPDPAHLFRIDALELDVPRWPFLTIVPVGLAVIGWRFALRAAQAAWMTDDELAARDEALEREVAAADAAREQEDAALLMQHERQAAQGSGRVPSLTPETAREEVRRALGSERAPAAGASPQAPSPSQAQAEPAVRHLPGRSTDELPVYRELADDDDLSEPTARRGGAVAESSDGDEAVRPPFESSDILDPPSGMGGDDLVEDAVERLADTERLKIARDAGGSRADDDPSDPPEVETDRLPRPDLPAPDAQAGDAQVDDARAGDARADDARRDA